MRLMIVAEAALKSLLRFARNGHYSLPFGKEAVRGLLFFGVASFLLCSAAFAGTIQLPQSGQGLCYDQSGTVISCAGTGQDAAKLMGAAWPNPRFVVSGNCVVDNLTGLMWMQSPDGVTPRNWTGAFTYVSSINSLNLCGYADWRLPNINELRSLVHSGFNERICGGVSCSYLSDWLNTQGFSTLQRNNYWSSTTDANSVIRAWVVLMTDGFIDNIPKAGGYFVLPVRGGSAFTGTVQIPATGQTTTYNPGIDDGALKRGAAWPSPRFNNNGNGTVTDNLTGLIWLKNASCTDTAGGIVNTGFQIWTDALAWSNGLASGVCGLSDGSHLGDWRLPNREELESLIDFGFPNPAISNSVGTGHSSPGDPFDFVQGAYLTSTTFVGSTALAWVGYMDGSMTVSLGGKSDFVAVWPLRGVSGQMGDLTVSKSGAGAGAVKSSPAGIDCNASSSLCAVAFFPLGRVVSLSATPSVGGPTFSLFSGWSGDPACNGGKVTMIAHVSCTATFGLCASQPALVGATGYGSIALAYAGAASSGDTIKVIASNQQEVLDFHSGKSVTLQGGYDCPLSRVVSYTVVTGSLTVSTGAVTAQNVTIQ